MSITILREYQKNLIESTFTAWDSGATNVLVQSHTGSGKTIMLTEIVRRVNLPTVIVAHRLELVSQLSLALARAQVQHSLIISDNSIPSSIRLHLSIGKKHYFNPAARVMVASVDTLVRRKLAWAQQIKLVVIDEAAHVLRDNKWGKAVSMFPNARGLFVTATPTRADGRGLGRNADGLVDVLIEGPSMRKLIDDGYLSKYRIFAPPNNLDLSPVRITATGDYSPEPLKETVRRAKITGDIVDHYIRHAQGELGITFAVSVEAAQELANAYEGAGVPAVCLHADIGITERASIMRRFREGIIKQIVNVDILAEGVDVPAVRCVSLGRPTMSYGLLRQQIGRALRPSEGKQHAIILDHVGNIMRHGLPDASCVWTLESKDRKSRSTTTIPLRTCLNSECVAVFLRVLDRCPYCSHPIPLHKERATPAQVEGDLRELDYSMLSTLNKEIARIDGAPRIPHGAGAVVTSSIIKKHNARQEAQRQLREVIAQWAGVHHAEGESDSEIQRRFYYTFGIDILTAQTLGTKEAQTLIDTIRTKD